MEEAPGTLRIHIQRLRQIWLIVWMRQWNRHYCTNSCRSWRDMWKHTHVFLPGHKKYTCLSLILCLWTLALAIHVRQPCPCSASGTSGTWAKRLGLCLLSPSLPKPYWPPFCSSFSLSSLSCSITLPLYKARGSLWASLVRQEATRQSSASAPSSITLNCVSW